MNQKKIGMFLKELRKEKHITQEKLAEMLGVTNRSISRWENGINMPDLDLVIELSEIFDVSIEEFLDGERKFKMNDKETKEKMLKVADYEAAEKQRFSGRVCGLFIAAVIAFIIYGVLEFTGLASKAVYDDIASFSLGLVFGTLLVGVLYTSRYMSKIQAFKKRILWRQKSRKN